MKETENENDKTTKSIKKLESVKLEPNKKQKTYKVIKQILIAVK